MAICADFGDGFLLWMLLEVFYAHMAANPLPDNSRITKNFPSFASVKFAAYNLRLGIARCFCNAWSFFFMLRCDTSDGLRAACCVC